jgi:hypothetical protein
VCQQALPNTYSDVTQTREVPCPPGWTSQAGTQALPDTVNPCPTSLCREREEFFDNSPYVADPTEPCTTCDEESGMECPDGTQLDKLIVLPGWWRSHKFSHWMRPCPMGVFSCPGGLGYPGAVNGTVLAAAGANGTTNGDFYSDNLCEAGHTGPSCSVCDDNYYMSSGKKGCIRCDDPSSSEETFVALGVVLFILVVGTILMFNMKKIFDRVTGGVVKDKRMLKLIRKQVKTVTKILFSSYQIVGNLSSSLDVAYPSLMAQRCRSVPASSIARGSDLLLLSARAVRRSA